MVGIAGRMRANRSWLVILGITAVTFLGLGTPWYAMGVFFTPLVEDFGWGRGIYAVATSIHVVLSTLASLPVGCWVDRWGPRRVMLANAVAGGVIWLLISQVGLVARGAAMWQVYLLYAALGLTAAGLGTVPTSVLVMRWFSRRPGLAMGLSIVGSGLPGVIMVPLSAPFIATHGWRALALLLGVLVWAVCIPAILWLLRDSPPGQEQRQVITRQRVAGVPAAVALGMLPFWFIGSAYLLTQFGSVAVQMHAIPFLMDRGLSRQAASEVWGVLALSGTVGKVGLGYAADRFSARWVAFFSFLVQAVALSIALNVPGPAGVWLFALLSGLGMGGQFVARPLLIQEHFGLAAFGTISGLLAMFMLPGVAAGQPLAGFLYDLTGSYAMAYTLFIGTFVAGMMALLPLREGGHQTSSVVRREA